MSLPSRFLAVAILASGFCGCATHDRLAYEHDYWRGRNGKRTDSTKPGIDADTQAKLDAAAAATAPGAAPGSVGTPAIPDNAGLPQDPGFGAPAAPAAPPAANPFEAPAP